ncbi:CPCC family cysteine-rich protein [Paenibacillus amylolyticus]|uniref:CPCC family cysteine-rich protein n=1 Tax=Paenibacillus amylolyticus TaxID=1451 RepID=UPI000FDC5F77|nr:CPCC family cysteine-rich protein [Paenibacillus amylolyticus]
MTNLFTCPCCGYKTLDEEPSGTYNICSICFWEDDGVQLDDPDYAGGANVVSLREGQSNFLKFGACEERCIQFVRKPNENDVFEGPKKINSSIQRV